MRLFTAGPGDLDLLFDLVLAYFIACYHLRDWLLRDDPGVEAALERLFANSAPLRLAADIANIAKHFDLTNTPRTERQLSFAREHVLGGMGWFGPDSRLVVLSRGEKVDVQDLIQSCESAWANFLREQGKR